MIQINISRINPKLTVLALSLVLSVFIVTPEALAAFSITQYPVPTSLAEPAHITLGPDGNLWFTEYSGDKIGKITPSGTITEYPVPTFASRPNGITAGPNGNLWFTEYNGSNIGEITTSGTITEYPVPTFASGPNGITAGPNGNLWFTESTGNNIGEITTSGTITEYPVPTSGSDPLNITAGPDGNLWFTEVLGNNIGKITPSGTITEYPVPTSGSSLHNLVTGPDGNIWFTEENGNNIGEITTSGTITEYPDPTVGSEPFGIANGPDGNIWFTEYSGDNISKLILPMKPAIVNQTVRVVSGSSVTINVLADVSGDPDPASLKIVSSPSHGTAVDPPGSLTYTPASGYVGSDSLVYQVCSLDDEGICAQATLTFDDTAVPAISAPNTGYGAPQSNSPTALFVSSVGIIMLGIITTYIHRRRSTN